MTITDKICAVLDQIDPLTLQSARHAGNGFQRKVESDLSPAIESRSIGGRLRDDVRDALQSLGFDPDKPE